MPIPEAKVDTTFWVKLRDDPRLSWHIVNPFTPDLLEAMGAQPGSIVTRCGRWITAIPVPTSDDLPMGQKSCEHCLRLEEHDEER